MQRYHSGRTRCQVNQEVASTDAPTPRIDSQPLWTDEAGRESADASIASVPVEGYRCQLTKQASCHSYLERPASERPSRGPEVEDHHRYGVVHPGREPTDGHRLQRPHMTLQPMCPTDPRTPSSDSFIVDSLQGD